jgi:hypothetical protein
MKTTKTEVFLAGGGQRRRQSVGMQRDYNKSVGIARETVGGQGGGIAIAKRRQEGWCLNGW